MFEEVTVPKISHNNPGWCKFVKHKVETIGPIFFNSLSAEELCEYYIQANHLIRKSNKYNFEYCKFPVPTPWNLPLLEEWLVDYHDRDLIKFLKYGWPLELKHVPGQVPIPPNQKGASQFSDKLSEYLKVEVEQRSAIGPFTNNPFGPSPFSEKCDHLKIVTPFFLCFIKSSLKT